ncbi:MAG TPA: DUF4249 domain-containing protein [Bacteroidales bacterium]|nr:DUF4249 domain-containing protein [Bacteroidales bacterium]
MLLKKIVKRSDLDNFFVFKAFVFILVFATILCSCTKEIEIDIPPSKPKLVVYSTFVPFTPPQPKNFEIKVFATAHIFDTAKYPITDAIVRLYKNGQFYDTLHYYPASDCYTMPGMFFTDVGDEYSLIVERDGFETVTASTYIPSKVEIEDVTITPIAYIDEFGGAVSEVEISFIDRADEVNYYEIAISDISFDYEDYRDFYPISTSDNLITSQSYYPDLIRFDVPFPRSLLFSDSGINGEKHTLKVYYVAGQKILQFRWIIQHYISVHFRTVTKEYYDFKTSSIQQDYAKREDILYGMGEPVNVISNIENGFGIFSGFNNDFKSFRIDSTAIIF